MKVLARTLKAYQKSIIIIIITLFKSQIILAEHECSANWGDCKSNKSNQINQIKCWFLRRGENRSTRRKTSRSKVENQQTQPTYDVGSGSRTRDTLVEGERDHHCANHCANPAPHKLFKVGMLGHHIRDSLQILNCITFNIRLKILRRKQERFLVWAMFCSRKHLNKTKLRCVVTTVTVVPYLNAMSWIHQCTQKTRMSWFHQSRSILYPWKKFVLTAKKSREHCLSQMRR